MIPSGLPVSRRPIFAPSPPRLKQVHSRYALDNAAVSKLGQLRLPYLLFSMRYAWVMSSGSTPRGKRPGTLGIHSDMKRFSSLKKAEEYMAKPTGTGDPSFDDRNSPRTARALRPSRGPAASGPFLC